MSAFVQIRTKGKEKEGWKKAAKNHKLTLSDFFRLGANMLVDRPELLDATSQPPERGDEESWDRNFSYHKRTLAELRVLNEKLSLLVSIKLDQEEEIDLAEWRHKLLAAVEEGEAYLATYQQVEDFLVSALPEDEQLIRERKPYTEILSDLIDEGLLSYDFRWKILTWRP